MHSFFQTSYDGLVDSPNGTSIWWHSMPLPNGSRISGNQPDKDMQFKMWDAMQIANDGGLSGKRVLDIGANDGFFSIAALMAGAASVTSIDAAWKTWPQNIEFASAAWVSVRKSLQGISAPTPSLADTTPFFCWVFFTTCRMYSVVWH